MDDKKFIWGVPCMDLPGEYDLELTYDESSDRYHLSVETIYYFSCIEDEISYYLRLLRCFETWMKNEGYQTNGEFSLNDILYYDVMNFRHIEDAYYWFKFNVEAYAIYHGQM